MSVPTAPVAPDALGLPSEEYTVKEPTPPPLAPATATTVASTANATNAKGRRIVICGCGVIGASIAYYLSKLCAANDSITIIERAFPACAASGNAGGFLASDWCEATPIDKLCRISFALHESLPSELFPYSFDFRRLTTICFNAREKDIGPAPADGMTKDDKTQVPSLEPTTSVHPRPQTATPGIDQSKSGEGVSPSPKGIANTKTDAGGEERGVRLRSRGCNRRLGVPDWVDGPISGPTATMGTPNTTAQVDSYRLTYALIRKAQDSRRLGPVRLAKVCGLTMTDGRVNGVRIRYSDDSKNANGIPARTHTLSSPPPPIDVVTKPSTATGATASAAAGGAMEEVVPCDIVVIAMGPWSGIARGWFEQAMGKSPDVSGPTAPPPSLPVPPASGAAASIPPSSAASPAAVPAEIVPIYWQFLGVLTHSIVVNPPSQPLPAIKQPKQPRPAKRTKTGADTSPATPANAATAAAITASDEPPPLPLVHNVLTPHALFVRYQLRNEKWEEPEVYPRPNGEVMISGFGLKPEVPTTDDPLLVVPRKDYNETLHSMGKSISSALRDAAVLRSVACYMPAARDGTPIIGSLPESDNAFICAGHTCWGVLMAPASGLAMAELILNGKASAVDLTPFDPRRFVAKSGKPLPLDDMSDSDS